MKKSWARSVQHAVRMQGTRSLAKTLTAITQLAYTCTSCKILVRIAVCQECQQLVHDSILPASANRPLQQGLDSLLIVLQQRAKWRQVPAGAAVGSAVGWILQECHGEGLHTVQSKPLIQCKHVKDVCNSMRVQHQTPQLLLMA